MPQMTKRHHLCAVSKGQSSPHKPRRSIRVKLFRAPLGDSSCASMSIPWAMVFRATPYCPDPRRSLILIDLSRLTNMFGNVRDRQIDEVVGVRPFEYTRSL
jgi:hypothetical protein